MKHSSTQLSFLQDDNEPVQPLPLQVALKYQFFLQYHQQPDDTILYAVQDWIAGLTGESDTKKIAQMWNVFKKQTSISNRTLKLPYKARDGKTYQRDFVNDETLYQFAAYARATQDRPQINEIKNFLAKAGAFVDAIRQDPESAERAIASKRRLDALASGKDDSWITARELGIEARNQCTAAIMAANPQTNIGETTNMTYKDVLGSDAAQLRAILSMGKKQNPRDELSITALSYLQVAETSIATALKGLADNEIVPLETIKTVVRLIAQITGQQANEMALALKIDLITGRKLLS